MLLEGGRAGNSFTKKFLTVLASGFSRIFLKTASAQANRQFSDHSKTNKQH